MAQKIHNAMKFRHLEDHNENQTVLNRIRYFLEKQRRLFEAYKYFRERFLHTSSEFQELHAGFRVGTL